jgi:hypothetical protein
MVLVERGLIDLDRSIDEYVGDAKVSARAKCILGARKVRVREVAREQRARVRIVYTTPWLRVMW